MDKSLKPLYRCKNCKFFFSVNVTTPVASVEEMFSNSVAQMNGVTREVGPSYERYVEHACERPGDLGVAELVGMSADQCTPHY